MLLPLEYIYQAWKLKVVAKKKIILSKFFAVAQNLEKIVAECWNIILLYQHFARSLYFFLDAVEFKN